MHYFPIISTNECNPQRDIACIEDTIQTQLDNAHRYEENGKTPHYYSQNKITLVVDTKPLINKQLS